jgi:hypothetical protein
MEHGRAWLGADRVGEDVHPGKPRDEFRELIWIRLEREMPHAGGQARHVAEVGSFERPDIHADIAVAQHAPHDRDRLGIVEAALVAGEPGVEIAERLFPTGSDEGSLGETGEHARSVIAPPFRPYRSRRLRWGSRAPPSSSHRGRFLDLFRFPSRVSRSHDR